MGPMILRESIATPPAKAVIQHLRSKLDKWGAPIARDEHGAPLDPTVEPMPIRCDDVGRPIIEAHVEIVGEEIATNVITTVGRDFLHTQGYGTSPAGNGLNYIGLSNDALTENAASTTLSSEIAANGLTRAIGTVSHTTGTSTTTVAKTFTCTTAQQACQKAALFTASSGGTMNHALSFTQRTLQVNDTIAITFTITLGA
jgi:hypothetical protein